MKDETMSQVAPFPDALGELVSRLRYRDNWRFDLTVMDRGQGSSGLTLVITAQVADTYNRHEQIRVAHYMPVPPAAYDQRSWRRWLLDQIFLVERHEAMEFFQLLGDDSIGIPDERPYAPSHGPGNDPYMIREPDGTELDRLTSFDGKVGT